MDEIAWSKRVLKDDESLATVDVRETDFEVGLIDKVALASQGNSSTDDA